jgi:MraZ protein
MWYGEYTHTLDDKDRFILPAKFRDKIRQLEKKRFFMTLGLDGCLFLFHEEVWEGLEAKLKVLPFTKQQSRFFNRLFFSRAQEVELDSQGRVNIPGYLKEISGIKKEIIIIGVSDRIEVWDKEAWNKFCGDNDGKFEEVSERLFE